MKKSNFILGFYVGVIALCVATVSMSIAWYASSTQVRLEGIEMTVDCDRDLGISLERDGKYVDKLEPDDLLEVGLFSPVTAAHADRWKTQKSDMPVFYDETKYSSVEETELVTVADHGYYSQKFYLKSDDDIYVTVGVDNTFINPNPEYNKLYAKELYKEYQDGSDEDLKALSEEDIVNRLNRLVESMRYSILITSEKDYDYAIIDPHKKEETVFGGLLDNDKDHFYDHFVRGGDELERVYGEYTGTPIWDDVPQSGDTGYKDPNEEPSAFNARHRDGVRKFNQTESEKPENGFSFMTEPSINLQDFSKEAKPFHIPVYRNQPQEIVISIYIEGWDLDSINCTKGATFISNLEFKIEREQ